MKQRKLLGLAVSLCVAAAFAASAAPTVLNLKDGAGVVFAAEDQEDGFRVSGKVSASEILKHDKVIFTGDTIIDGHIKVSKNLTLRSEGGRHKITCNGGIEHVSGDLVLDIRLASFAGKIEAKHTPNYFFVRSGNYSDIILSGGGAYEEFYGGSIDNLTITGISSARLGYNGNISIEKTLEVTDRSNALLYREVQLGTTKQKADMNITDGGMVHIRGCLTTWNTNATCKKGTIVTDSGDDSEQYLGNVRSDEKSHLILRNCLIHGNIEADGSAIEETDCTHDGMVWLSGENADYTSQLIDCTFAKSLVIGDGYDVEVTGAKVDEKGGIFVASTSKDLSKVSITDLKRATDIQAYGNVKVTVDDDQIGKVEVGTEGDYTGDVQIKNVKEIGSIYIDRGYDMNVDIDSAKEGLTVKGSVRVSDVPNNNPFELKNLKEITGETFLTNSTAKFTSVDGELMNLGDITLGSSVLTADDTAKTGKITADHKGKLSIKNDHKGVVVDGDIRADEAEINIDTGFQQYPAAKNGRVKVNGSVTAVDNAKVNINWFDDIDGNVTVGKNSSVNIEGSKEYPAKTIEIKGDVKADAGASLTLKHANVGGDLEVKNFAADSNKFQMKKVNVAGKSSFSNFNGLAANKELKSTNFGGGLKLEKSELPHNAKMEADTFFTVKKGLDLVDSTLCFKGEIDGGIKAKNSKLFFNDTDINGDIVTDKNQASEITFGQSSKKVTVNGFFDLYYDDVINFNDSNATFNATEGRNLIKSWTLTEKNKTDRSAVININEGRFNAGKQKFFNIGGDFIGTINIKGGHFFFDRKTKQLNLELITPDYLFFNGGESASWWDVYEIGNHKAVHGAISPTCEMDGCNEYVTFDFADAKDLYFKNYTPEDNYLCLGDDEEAVILHSLGHNISSVKWSDWKTNGYNYVQKATCTAHCARCGEDLKCEDCMFEELTPEAGVYTRQVKATFHHIFNKQTKTVGEATFTDMASMRKHPYAYVKYIPGQSGEIQIAVAFGNLRPEDYIVHVDGPNADIDGYNYSIKRQDFPFSESKMVLNKRMGAEPVVIATFKTKASQMTMPYALEVRHIANDAVINECSIDNITVRNYALQILEDKNNTYSWEMKDFCRALLAYGAAAQAYDKVNTSTMANAPYFGINDPCHRVDLVGTGAGAKDWETADINQFKEARLDAQGINGQLDNLTEKQGMNETLARYMGMMLTSNDKPFISLVFKAGDHADMGEAIDFLKDHISFYRNDSLAKLREGEDYQIEHKGTGTKALIFIHFNGSEIVDFMTPGALTNPDASIQMVINNGTSTTSYPVSFRSYVGSVASNNDNPGLIRLSKALVSYDKYAKILEKSMNG
ncbi:MAG: hypothetical protein IKH76_07730 [Clostridiales bacterium]|nr:hypothetical protein [Clostridiales bacterium]